MLTLPAALEKNRATRTTEYAHNPTTGEVFRATTSEEWAEELDEWRTAMRTRPGSYWWPTVACPMPKGHIMFAKGSRYVRCDTPPKPVYEENGCCLYAGQRVCWRTMFGEWFSGDIVGMDPMWQEGEEPCLLVKRWDGGACCLPVSKLKG